MKRIFQAGCVIMSLWACVDEARARALSAVEAAVTRYQESPFRVAQGAEPLHRILQHHIRNDRVISVNDLDRLSAADMMLLADLERIARAENGARSGTAGWVELNDTGKQLYEHALSYARRQPFSSID